MKITRTKYIPWAMRGVTYTLLVESESFSVDSWNVIECGLKDFDDESVFVRLTRLSNALIEVTKGLGWYCAKVCDGPEKISYMEAGFIPVSDVDGFILMVKHGFGQTMGYTSLAEDRLVYSSNLLTCRVNFNVVPTTAYGLDLVADYLETAIKLEPAEVQAEVKNPFYVGVAKSHMFNQLGTLKAFHGQLVLSETKITDNLGILSHLEGGFVPISQVDKIVTWGKMIGSPVL